MSLTRSRIIGALLLTVLTVFALSVLWEFELEERFCDILGISYDNSFETEERWRFVLTSTAFAALSLVIPALLLFNITDHLKHSYRSLTNAKRLAQSLSRIDSLTGLPNRSVFNEELQFALVKSKRRNRRCSLLAIDLNNFKLVNGLYGQATGDAVLRVVADRLAELAPRGMIAARVGGDEFALLVTDIEPEEPPQVLIEETQLALAKEITTRIGESFSVGSANFDIGITIGIAISHAESDPESLFRAADMALHHAKKVEHGNFDIFDPSMGEEIQNRADLQRQMREAITGGTLVPYYQPLTYLGDRTPFGFELLARWPRNQDRITPDVFIPIAEELGLIDELTFQLLRQACHDMKDWPPHFRLALNLSPTQLAGEELPQRILGILTETGTPPGRLEIEVTESAVMTHLERARKILASLRNTGISIALDDFGTGHSSLAQLRTIQFDKIKIDRSFIRSMRMNEDSRKLVASILGLGQNLELEITAEGIETEEDAEWLTAHGCTLGQGALFGMPVPAEDVLSFLIERHPARKPVAAAS
ncbi:MAG: putative bifunctional diguanylate cyclase/phosphodiesterase [Methyloligella sp. ZOD6]